MNSRDSNLSVLLRQSNNSSNLEKKTNTDIKRAYMNSNFHRQNDIDHLRKETAHKISISVVQEIEQEQGNKYKWLSDPYENLRYNLLLNYICLKISILFITNYV